MFKTLAVLFTLMITMTLSACGGEADSASLSSSPVVSFDGTWKMVDSTPDFNMFAEIADDTIEITWISDDTRGLYWKGTFDTSGKITDGMKIVSAGDTAAMDASMLGSTSTSKEFKYSDDRLWYDFSIAGVTKTLELKR